MACAIVINLDYQLLPAGQGAELWSCIRQAMLEAGFVQNGRQFVCPGSCPDAVGLAREAIESLETHQDYHNKRIFNFIRDFYAFDLASAINLLLPSVEGIVVNEGFAV